MRHHYDFSPLFRTAVGFDRLARLAETAASNSNNVGFPPYNIELLGENLYQITMAVAGFSMNDLEITSEGDKLLVKGTRPNAKQERQFLHQGIAERSFERTFQLADYVIVKGAHLENGLLNIELIRELPETMKPRTIEIASRKLVDVDV